MEVAWGLVIIGGPILLAIVLAWAMLHNHTSRRQLERTEKATRQMYKEQNRLDAARDGEAPAISTQRERDFAGQAPTASPHNLSTEHQPEGDARFPKDTLDRERQA